MSQNLLVATPEVKSLLKSVQGSALYVVDAKAPRLFEVKARGTRGSIRWVVSRGMSLDREEIHAWMEYAHYTLGSAALVTVDAPLAECVVHRDGFGDPMVRIGSVSFSVTEGEARTLEAAFGFGSSESAD